MTEEKKKKKKSYVYYGCLTTIIIFLVFIIFVFISFYNAFSGTDNEENTKRLIQKAPSIFKEYSSLSYPNNASIKHISAKRLGPNGSTDLVFLVPDIDLFIKEAKKIYTFKNSKMNYPEIELNMRPDIIYTNFCNNIKVTKQVLEIKNKDPFKNFCGKKEIFIARIDKLSDAQGLIVILHNEKLVWLNYTEWF